MSVAQHKTKAKKRARKRPPPPPAPPPPDLSELVLRVFGGVDQQRLPLEAIWLDAAGVGRMIGKTAREIRERTSREPGFPPAADGEGTRHARWNAAEVQAWMLAQRKTQ